MCVLLSVLVSSHPSFANCPLNTIAYWQLEEAANAEIEGYQDASGNGHTAVCSGNCPTFVSEGAVGGGQSFNGFDTGIAVPADPAFDFGGTNGFSIEMWLKRAPGLSTEEVLVARNDPQTGALWWIALDTAASAVFYLESGTGEVVLLQGPKDTNPDKVLDNDVWHHIAVVKNVSTNQFLFYVDGELEDSDTVQYSSTFDAAEPVTIGYLSANGSSTDHFSGIIDEVALYDRTLSQAEIKRHYYLARSYCGDYDNSLRIMPLGDSITWGDNEIGPGSSAYEEAYRRPLWNTLYTNRYWVDFVGSQLAGDPDVFDIDNEGHPGYTDDQVAANVYSWLEDEPADIVLLHIGTNSVDPSPDDVAAVLDEIDQFSEKTTVVLAKIINRATSDELLKRQNTTAFNINLGNMVQSRIENGDKIILVDMEQGADLDYTVGVDFIDDIHPNSSGYVKMANVWFTALNTFLPQSEVPKIEPIPDFNLAVGETFVYDVDASGLPGPAYFLSSGPSGMTINGTSGVITWTPGPEDYIDCDVEVLADNWVGSDLKTFRLLVNDTPVITSTPPVTATEGMEYVYEPEVQDRDIPPDPLSWSLTNPPTGMTVDGVTGKISWTPGNVSSSGPVTLTVDDGNGGSDNQNFTVTVINVNDTPVITGYTPLSVPARSTLYITLNDLTVEDPDNVYPDDFTLKVYSGANYTTKENAVTPDDNYVGQLQIQVSVNDGDAESNIVNMNVTVTENSTRKNSSRGCFISTVFGTP